MNFGWAATPICAATTSFATFYQVALGGTLIGGTLIGGTLIGGTLYEPPEPERNGMAKAKSNRQRAQGISTRAALVKRIPPE